MSYIHRAGLDVPLTCSLYQLVPENSYFTTSKILNLSYEIFHHIKKKKKMVQIYVSVYLKTKNKLECMSWQQL